MKLYSKLAAEIHRKINQEHLELKEVLILIIKSYEYTSSSSSVAEKKLHNKLLNVLSETHGGHDTSRIVKEYWLHSVKLADLEQKFSTDPSDYSVVYKLAVEYARVGNDERAKQLLDRVARSGYKEKELATSFISNHFGKDD